MSQRPVTKDGRQMGRTEDIFEVSKKQLVGGEVKLLVFLLRKEQQTSLKKQSHVAQFARISFASADKGWGGRNSMKSGNE